MKISRRKLISESQDTGFRPEVLEKVIHLMNLLEGFNRHPFLKGADILNELAQICPGQAKSAEIFAQAVGVVGGDTLAAGHGKQSSTCCGEAWALSADAKDSGKLDAVEKIKIRDTLGPKYSFQ